MCVILKRCSYLMLETKMCYIAFFVLTFIVLRTLNKASSFLNQQYSEHQTVVDRVRGRGAAFLGRDTGALHAGRGISAQKRSAAVLPLDYGRLKFTVDVKRHFLRHFLETRGNDERAASI
ncbi:hypothetical protein Y032_0103g3571 [Ancylostoma ceylanicum]|uniref:Uncharacterized protein n=1 Tax=Ancylostoma ceylanicum TaxID=53326 RepID=A0A016TH04_9BILA|nr:hypothetical protein Y032_0103g3571 [Ancylostoma ceylanicum]